MKKLIYIKTIGATLGCIILSCQSCAPFHESSDQGQNLHSIRDYIKNNNAFQDYSTTKEFVYNTLGQPTAIDKTSMGTNETWDLWNQKMFVKLSNYPDLGYCTLNVLEADDQN